MKGIIIVLLAGMLSLGLSSFALAGMNHQPHSVKTFMGKARKASTELTQTKQKKATTAIKRVSIDTSHKGPRGINR